MSKKRILIINPTSLFPKIMGNQDRVINMINCLSKVHEVDVITLYKTSEERLLSEKGLTSICNNYCLLRKPNHNVSRHFGTTPIFKSFQERVPFII